MSTVLYFTLILLITLIFSSSSFFIKRYARKIENVSISLEEEFNETSLRLTIGFSILLFFLAIIFIFLEGTQIRHNSLLRSTRYFQMVFSSGTLILFLFPYFRKFARYYAFLFCIFFNVFSMLLLIFSNFHIKTVPLFMLSSIFAGLSCPAPSYIIGPFCFFLWLIDMIIFKHFFPDFIHSPLRPLLTNTAIVFFAGSLMSVVSYHIKLREYNAREALEKEKKKSDKLLKNIFPEDIVRELKENGKAEPRRYTETTILFADIVGFTSVAEYIDPAVLVNWLDEIFSKFDSITERYNLEKLKTIGDCYMTVCGVPLQLEEHALKTVKAAFEMLKVVEAFRPIDTWESKNPFFKIRIGIHSGTVIAGVIGQKKFSYDIWGDNVNIASRLEGAGEPGRINVSRETAELIKDHYRCISRGFVEVRNRAPLEMFWVEEKFWLESINHI